MASEVSCEVKPEVVQVIIYVVYVFIYIVSAAIHIHWQHVFIYIGGAARGWLATRGE